MKKREACFQVLGIIINNYVFKNMVHTLVYTYMMIHAQFKSNPIIISLQLCYIIIHFYSLLNLKGKYFQNAPGVPNALNDKIMCHQVGLSYEFSKNFNNQSSCLL